MDDRYWLIRGYDSTKLIFETRANLGQFTEGQMRLLLQALAAKEGLSYSEIVGAFARHGTPNSNDLLAVHKDFNQPTYMCGSNPHFVASVVDSNGKIITSRKGTLRPSPGESGTDIDR